jgi:hypothetical protein
LNIPQVIEPDASTTLSGLQSVANLGVVLSSSLCSLFKHHHCHSLQSSKHLTKARILGRRTLFSHIFSFVPSYFYLPVFVQIESHKCVGGTNGIEILNYMPLTLNLDIILNIHQGKSLTRRQHCPCTSLVKRCHSLPLHRLFDTTKVVSMDSLQGEVI